MAIDLFSSQPSRLGGTVSTYWLSMREASEVLSILKAGEFSSTCGGPNSNALTLS